MASVLLTSESTEVGKWTASWSSGIAPWTVSQSTASRTPHAAYLNTRNNVLLNAGLEVDPYLGRASNPADRDPASWQSFYTLLEPDFIADFKRATNNEVDIVYTPRAGAVTTYFGLHVLHFDQNSMEYRWESVLESWVPVDKIMATNRVTISKIRKRKGSVTQSTALLMFSAADFLGTFEVTASRYSSMFSLMRRSYHAKERSYTGPSRSDAARTRHQHPSTTSLPNAFATQTSSSGSSNGAHIDAMAMPVPPDPVVWNDNQAALDPLGLPSSQAERAGPSDLSARTLAQPGGPRAEAASGITYGTRILSLEESRSEYWGIRIAAHLGDLHRAQGYPEAIPEIQAPLLYYSAARSRMDLASKYSEDWTPVLRLLASRASARLEIAIRDLLSTPSRRMSSTYNFYGADDTGGPGTIEISVTGEIIELNRDELTSRRGELHDNIAILARWTHLQAMLSNDEVMTTTLFEQIQRVTLMPYYHHLVHRAPTHIEIIRFWRFVELEYLEYWFYFLQSSQDKALYQMTVALQNAGRVLRALRPSENERPSLETPLQRNRAFWFQELPA